MKDLIDILIRTLGENGKHHPRDLDPIRALVADGVRGGIGENGAVISRELSLVLGKIFLLDNTLLPEYCRKDHLIVRVSQELSIPSANPFLKSIINVETGYAREVAERELRKKMPGIRIHLPDPLRKTLAYIKDEADLAGYFEPRLLHDHHNHYVFTLNGKENGV